MICRTCNTANTKSVKKFGLENSRNNVEDLDADGRTLLKRNLETLHGEGGDNADGSGQVPMLRFHCLN
jgi:hypothetical protein